VHFVLDGSGPAKLEPPSLDAWPKLAFDTSKSKRVNLDTLTKAEIATWKVMWAEFTDS
jgi:fumarate hydratase class I